MLESKNIEISCLEIWERCWFWVGFLLGVNSKIVGVFEWRSWGKGVEYKRERIENKNA